MALAFFEHLRVHPCFSLLAAPSKNSELTKKVRALADRPAPLVADEPIGNLDTITAEAVFVLLLDVVCSTGTAAPIATHHPELALRTGRVVRLERGRLMPIARRRCSEQVGPAAFWLSSTSPDFRCFRKTVRWLWLVCGPAVPL